MPLRRYQTPSLVRQTSSASTFPPLVNIIIGLLPWRAAMPGPLVETGSRVERVCEVETPLGEDFAAGVADGDGDGETDGDGDGSVGTGVEMGAATVGFCGTASTTGDGRLAA